MLGAQEKATEKVAFLRHFLVPGTGIEPVRHYWREILSLLCLPISPSGQGREL